MGTKVMVGYWVRPGQDRTKVHILTVENKPLCGCRTPKHGPRSCERYHPYYVECPRCAAKGKNG